MRAAAALAFAVALRMRAAGRGGSEDEVHEVDEAEDEEEVVDAGWAVMRAGLWAAACAAATAGRMEGMSSGCKLGAGGLGGAGRDLAARRADLVSSGGGGRRGAVAFSFWAWLGRGPAMCEVVWAGVCGGEQCAWAAFRGRGGGPGSSGLCAGAVGRPLGGVGLPRGVGLLLAGVCGFSSVGGGEGCPAGGCVAGVCWCSGGSGRPVSRGPGVRAMVGMCGSPGQQREGRGMGGDCTMVCGVSVYVFARRGALAWPAVGRAVWRRSLPSSAAAARILQTSLRIWLTSWSVVGRGYASFWLRPTRLRTVWMAWYPQVRDCCGLRGGVWPRVRARLDLCVGGGDGPNPGHGPRGWPAALDPVGQAEHGQSQVVARLP